MQGLLVLLALMAVSVLLRIDNKNRTQKQEIPEHTEPSPLSQALQELVAQAGGIYLSLVLLVSFLQIDLPERWAIIGIKMDPLAFISLGLAMIQPVVIRIYTYFTIR